MPVIGEHYHAPSVAVEHAAVPNAPGHQGQLRGFTSPVHGVHDTPGGRRFEAEQPFPLAVVERDDAGVSPVGGHIELETRQVLPELGHGDSLGMAQELPVQDLPPRGQDIEPFIPGYDADLHIVPGRVKATDDDFVRVVVPILGPSHFPLGANHGIAGE